MKTVTYRQIRAAVPALNCLQEPEGAFSHLDDVVQFRIARLAQEVAAALRQFEAASMPRRLEYALRTKPSNGKPRGELVHPIGEDGAPQFGSMYIDPERQVEFEKAMSDMLDETVQLDVKEIRASQLKREFGTNGTKVTRIPSGFWHEQAPDGQKVKKEIGPSSILMGLEPFIVMDLEESAS